MSVYDPQTFASMTFTGSNATESVPHPIGEHLFVITKQEITAWQGKQDTTKSGLKCTLALESVDPDGSIKALTGREKNSLRYEMMLDLTPEGGLDMGKGMNVRLGRAREACNINDPTRPFAFDMFIGHQVKGLVSHETYKNQLVANVDSIAKP